MAPRGFPGGSASSLAAPAFPRRRSSAARTLISGRRTPAGFVRRSEEHTSELQSLAYLVCRLILSEEHTSELQSLAYLVCRLLLEKKKKKQSMSTNRRMQNTSKYQQYTNKTNMRNNPNYTYETTQYNTKKKIDTVVDITYFN